MNIQYYPTAADFLSRAGKSLARDEARYGLIMGLARILVENPHTYGKADPWFCSAGTETDLYAVAMRTPPYKVLLAYFTGDPKDIAERLVASVSKKSAVIPGVVGDKELADLFTKRWCAASGISIQDTMAQRIYRLVRVDDVPLSRGKFRPATMKDAKLVAAWTHAFNIDTYGPGRNLPETDITPKIVKREIFLWEDGQPVSMAAKSRPTDKGMTVNYVYTPPEYRRRGYATSCVAELCRNILQSGYRFCALYTDLANPTSNSIYKKIGFKEVGDSVEYTFVMPQV